ncbi:MAG: haloacid dehalogenase type II [Salinisphaeraceae bacterium]
MTPRTLVFDVNETLLDLAALDPVFADLFGDAGVRREWFALLLRWSMVTSLTGAYRDFTKLGAASLATLAESHDRTLSADDYRAVSTAIRELPPHPDVAPGLARLADAGFRLTALTNSAQAAVDEQLQRAGLNRYFEHILSVDAVQRFKPHPDVYAHAADTLAVAPADLCMVAAHDWDITGAMRAGFAGAYISRQETVCHRAGETPDLVARDLDHLADQLLGIN